MEGRRLTSALNAGGERWTQFQIARGDRLAYFTTFVPLKSADLLMTQFLREQSEASDRSDSSGRHYIADRKIVERSIGSYGNHIPLAQGIFVLGIREEGHDSSLVKSRDH